MTVSLLIVYFFYLVYAFSVGNVRLSFIFSRHLSIEPPKKPSDSDTNILGFTSLKQDEFLDLDQRHHPFNVFHDD